MGGSRDSSRRPVLAGKAASRDRAVPASARHAHPRVRAPIMGRFLCGSGTRTATSSPSRSRRASRSASRRSVLTRSAAARGIFDGERPCTRSWPAQARPARTRSGRPHRRPGPARELLRRPDRLRWQRRRPRLRSSPVDASDTPATILRACTSSPTHVPSAIPAFPVIAALPPRANRDGNPRQLTSEAPGRHTPYGLARRTSSRRVFADVAIVSVGACCRSRRPLKPPNPRPTRAHGRPVQYFQSVIAIELAVSGALMWQIRFFESSAAQRKVEPLPDARLRGWPPSSGCSFTSSSSRASSCCSTSSKVREPRPTRTERRAELPESQDHAGGQVACADTLTDPRRIRDARPSICLVLQSVSTWATRHSAARLLPEIPVPSLLRQRDMLVYRAKQETGATGLEPATSGVTGHFGGRQVDDDGHGDRSVHAAFAAVPEQLAWLSGAVSGVCCLIAARRGVSKAG